jgi:hypothetical protein
MFVVVDGRVDLLVKGHLVEELGPGGVLGEMALIDSVPRSASAVAKTDCKLVAIDQKRFTFLVQQTPHFALQIMRVIADRLRRMNEKLYTSVARSRRNPIKSDSSKCPPAGHDGLSCTGRELREVCRDPGRPRLGAARGLVHEHQHRFAHRDTAAVAEHALSEGHRAAPDAVDARADLDLPWKMHLAEVFHRDFHQREHVSVSYKRTQMVADERVAAVGKEHRVNGVIDVALMIDVVRTQAVDHPFGELRAVAQCDRKR